MVILSSNGSLVGTSCSFVRHSSPHNQLSWKLIPLLIWNFSWNVSPNSFILAVWAGILKLPISVCLYKIVCLSVFFLLFFGFFTVLSTKIPHWIPNHSSLRAWMTSSSKSTCQFSRWLASKTLPINQFVTWKLYRAFLDDQTLACFFKLSPCLLFFILQIEKHIGSWKPF